MTITVREIMSKQTVRGGWTKATLAQWGVPWPPPNGWKEQIISTGKKYEPSEPAE